MNSQLEIKYLQRFDTLLERIELLEKENAELRDELKKLRWLIEDHTTLRDYCPHTGK